MQVSILYVQKPNTANSTVVSEIQHYVSKKTRQIPKHSKASLFQRKGKQAKKPVVVMERAKKKNGLKPGSINAEMPMKAEKQNRSAIHVLARKNQSR